MWTDTDGGPRGVNLGGTGLGQSSEGQCKGEDLGGRTNFLKTLRLLLARGGEEALMGKRALGGGTPPHQRPAGLRRQGGLPELPRRQQGGHGGGALQEPSQVPGQREDTGKPGGSFGPGCAAAAASQTQGRLTNHKAHTGDHRWGGL